MRRTQMNQMRRTQMMKNNITSILRKNLILKRSAILSLIVILAINLTTVQNAATLEEALATGGKQQEETTQTQQTSNEDISNEDSIIDNSIDESLSATNNQSDQIINNETSNQQGQSYINGLQQIDLTQTPDSQAAQIVNGVNSMIYKTQSFIVQIIAYALTIMLTLRTLFDLTYIAIPFSRSLIDRISGTMGGNMGQNMGNMGGQSFGGQSGQFNQPPASGASGATSGATRVQLISDEARAAIQSPKVFRTYAKSMVVTLIATTVMLVLALTGALTDLGFIIGKALTAALGKVKIIL